jgi:DNA-binding response OmpR family regulator
MRNLVLIACADDLLLKTLASTLEKAGFVCLTANSGAEALATALGYGPQLAILHADLPDVQGTDVCLRLKQEPKTEKIAVLLVGKDTMQERFVGQEVGADAYLVGPCAGDTLVQKVRELYSALVLNAR